MAELSNDEDLVSRMEYYEYGMENAMKRKNAKFLQKR